MISKPRRQQKAFREELRWRAMDVKRKNIPVPMEKIWTAASTAEKHQLERAAHDYKLCFENAVKACIALGQDATLCVFQTLLSIQGKVSDLACGPEITERKEFREAAQAFQAMNGQISTLSETKGIPIIASLEVCRAILDSEVKQSRPYQIFQHEDEDEDEQSDSDSEYDSGSSEEEK